MYEPGTVIGGKYRLITQVGAGGMATVYRATHEHLGHDVAVKFLTHPGTNADSLVARFLDEARTAASVRHRNVIDILDFGLTDDGRPYMVMEFMEGESLADRIERSPALTLSEVTLTVSLSLGGLAAVHDKGIIHRDLKPDNIFLTYDADGFFPKILDFGVSKDIGRDELGGRAVRTRDGVLLGTPQYMSPEQARGVRDIDRRTDIYSMGVILYEILAGRRPFDSENVGDILMMVITGEHIRIDQLCPDLPASLVEVIERAMARDREERYPDARAMRNALLTAMGANRPSMSSTPEVSGLWGLEITPPTMPAVRPGSGIEPPRLANPALGTSSPMLPSAPSASASAPTMQVEKHASHVSSAEMTIPFRTDTPQPNEIAVAPSLPKPRVTESWAPPPKRSGTGLFLLLLLAGMAGLLVLELRYPGGIAAAMRKARGASADENGSGLVGADGAPGSLEGTIGANADDTHIRVRLRALPDTAVVTADGRTYQPAELARLRDDEGTVTLLVRKRPEAFDLRVDAPGFLPFEGRRWAISDVSYRIRLDPAPDTSTPTVDAGTAEAPTPRRRHRRRR